MSEQTPGPEPSELIYDWNRADESATAFQPKVELDDETLRDGLQSPSVRSPNIDDKVRILHHMVDLGIDAVNIGLPGAGPHVVRDVTRLASEIVDRKLPISANCAARTLQADIRPIIEISQETGLAIEVACFIGSSPVRSYTEGWEIERMLRLTRDAVHFAISHDLPVMYVTEDTVRARPEDLKRLYTTAVEAGAKRVCVADTVGHCTPDGARRVVRFVRELVDSTGENVKVDWHGHRDRGLAVANALTAVEAGADRIHGTALGIGERVGNTPIDLLLVNLHLLGWRRQDLTALPEYCRLVSETTGVALPDNYPVVGRDAFRTGTGVHAASIIKARARGDEALADLVYSGVPAGLVGRRQSIEVGPMSGESNVIYWLQEHGFGAKAEVVREIFRIAKASQRMLSEDEILGVCRRQGLGQHS